MSSIDNERLTSAIIGAAIEVHKHLGPSLLEKYYQIALAHELKLRGIKAEREVLIPFVYKDLHREDCARADIIVENQVIIEVKACPENRSFHSKQLLTYLKMTGLKLGLVINFNNDLLTKGIIRVVNNLEE